VKKIILILLAILAVGSAPLSAGAVATIDKDELKAMLGSSELILVDVRAAADWDSSDSKIQGAVRLPADEIDTAVRNFPRDHTLVFYCA